MKKSENALAGLAPTWTAEVTAKPHTDGDSTLRTPEMRPDPQETHAAGMSVFGSCLAGSRECSGAGLTL